MQKKSKLIKYKPKLHSIQQHNNIFSVQFLKYLLKFFIEFINKSFCFFYFIYNKEFYKSYNGEVIIRQTQKIKTKNSRKYLKFN